MTLLTLDDIATHIGESREYVRDKVVKRADFPRPALVLSAKVKKWSSLAFEEWLMKQKKKWER